MFCLYPPSKTKIQHPPIGKMFLRSYGNQHHSSKNPGGVSSTCLKVNRQVDLSTGCGPCRASWTSSNPSQLLSGKPWRTLNYIITYGQESCCGSACFQRKFSITPLEKNVSLDSLEWVGRVLLYPCQRTTKVTQVNVKKDL